MFHNFECQSADDMWGLTTRAFRSPELSWTEIVGRDNLRTKEILHASISIADPRQRWIQTRLKAINVALAIAEVIWIINGRRDSTFIKAFFPGISNFAGNVDHFYGAYGYRLRAHFKVGDQLNRAYHALKSEPGSRQVVLSIWDPTKDMPEFDGSPRDKDIPCNISSLLKVRDNKLEWLQIMRSNDLHKGLPNNIVQFTSLQEIMAGWLGVGLGSYNHISDSLHVYDYEYDYILQNSDKNILKNADMLNASYEDSQRIFAAMAKAVDWMIGPNISVSLLTQAHHVNCQIPQAYSNMLLVLQAEILRRKGALKEAQQLMDKCTNQLFRKLWNRWMYREHNEWAKEIKLPV